MSTLKVHTIESAPNGSKSQLKESIEKFGMLPGLHGVSWITTGVRSLQNFT